MRIVLLLWRAALVAVGLVGSSLALAADFPAPKEADWTATDFRFHTGEVMPALRIHYTTVGSPSGEPVLVLHGTTGSGTGMLTPAFAGELFGPGQPLDATKYFIILPDAIGAGKTSKPSDGLRAKFPRYNYDDMVLAQYRLVTEGLGIRRLRLVIGNSMGGMHAWLWGVRYPEFMDALVPMACQPTEMAGRNWMMRRMLIDSVRKDPDWKGGDYVTQPRAVRAAAVFFGVATIGGSQALHKAAPTREKADKLLDDRLAAPFTADANDYLYQWESSGDYNPAPGVGPGPRLGARDQLGRRRTQSAGAWHHGARAVEDQGRAAPPHSRQRRDAGSRNHRDGALLQGAAGRVPGIRSKALTAGSEAIRSLRSHGGKSCPARKLRRVPRPLPVARKS